MSMVTVEFAAQKSSARYRTIVSLYQWKAPTWPALLVTVMAFSTASRLSTGSLKMICSGWPDAHLHAVQRVDGGVSLVRAGDRAERTGWCSFRVRRRP